MNRSILQLVLLTVFLVPAGAASADGADSARSGALYDTLAEMDRHVFDVAFVDCDPERFRALFTDDAEFYHDLAGPTYGQDVWTLKGCPRDDGVRRVLVPGSLAVYPMKDYGAVQMGEHWFVEEGAATSTLARFVHLWRLEDGQWRIARVLSFDHQSKPESEGPGATTASGREHPDRHTD